MNRPRSLSDKVADTIAAIGFGIVFFVLILFLAGCATKDGPAPKLPERVFVPVREPCISSDVPPAPERYADHDLDATADPAERLRKVGQANLQRRARLTIVEPAVAACR